MSVVFAMGLEAAFKSYDDESGSSLARINRFLEEEGRAPYVERGDIPDVYVGKKFGRSSLDHHSSPSLREIGELGSEARPRGFLSRIIGAFSGDDLEPLTPMSILAAAPQFVAFVPERFDGVVMTDLENPIGQTLFIGSLPVLFEQLVGVAPKLGIPLDDGRLADETAARIDDLEPFDEADSDELVDDLRTAWLVLHEGARMAMERGVALSLVG